jgi:hypothetical protein
VAARYRLFKFLYIVDAVVAEHKKVRLIQQIIGAMNFVGRKAIKITLTEGNFDNIVVGPA